MSNTNSFLLQLSFIPGLVPVEIACTEGDLRARLQEFDTRWTTRSNIAFMFAGVVLHSQTLMSGPFLMCNASLPEAIDNMVSDRNHEVIQHIVWAQRMRKRVEAGETILYRSNIKDPRVPLTLEYLDARLSRYDKELETNLRVLRDLCNVLQFSFNFDRSLFDANKREHARCQALEEERRARPKCGVKIRRSPNLKSKEQQLQERIDTNRQVINAIHDKHGIIAGQVNAYAELAIPVEMSVWKGNRLIDDNCSKHIAGKGSRVLIWMTSRFGDVGITDNLIDPCGYDARVDLSALTNIVDAGPREYVSPSDKRKMYFITVLQAWSNVAVMKSVAVHVKNLDEALLEARELAVSCIKMTHTEDAKTYELSAYDFVIVGDEIAIKYNMKESDVANEG